MSAFYRSDQNYGTIKVYGTTTRKYKVTLIKSCNVKNCRDLFAEPSSSILLPSSKGSAHNDEKLVQSISRTRSTIYELSSCNPWEFFVTMTLDAHKYDRFNLKKFHKDLSQYIRDFNKKYRLCIKYLLIPEKHNNGAWHFHGFFMGLPKNFLHKFSVNEHLPNKLLDRIHAGKNVYTWPAYVNKFGFSNFEPIDNLEAVSKYITKYITKDFIESITELNAHKFYASQGLKKAEVLHQGLIFKALPSLDFENDYVQIKWFDTFEEALTSFNMENNCVAVERDLCLQHRSLSVGLME